MGIRNLCVSACAQKTPNPRCYIIKRHLANTPRRHRLADGQLSSLYPPSPRFSSLGAASVMLCCFPPLASSRTPLRPSVCYQSISLVVNMMYTRVCCDHLNISSIFDPACIVMESGWSSLVRMPRLVVSPPSLSPSHPSTPPPSRWPALITLPPLFSSFGAACVKLCCIPPPSLVEDYIG